MGDNPRVHRHDAASAKYPLRLKKQEEENQKTAKLNVFDSPEDWGVTDIPTKPTESVFKPQPATANPELEIEGEIIPPPPVIESRPIETATPPEIQTTETPLNTDSKKIKIGQGATLSNLTKTAYGQSDKAVYEELMKLNPEAIKKVVKNGKTDYHLIAGKELVLPQKLTANEKELMLNKEANFKKKPTHSHKHLTKQKTNAEQTAPAQIKQEEKKIEKLSSQNQTISSSSEIPSSSSEASSSSETAQIFQQKNILSAAPLGTNKEQEELLPDNSILNKTKPTSFFFPDKTRVKTAKPPYMD